MSEEPLIKVSKTNTNPNSNPNPISSPNSNPPECDTDAETDPGEAEVNNDEMEELVLERDDDDDDGGGDDNDSGPANEEDKVWRVFWFHDFFRLSSEYFGFTRIFLDFHDNTYIDFSSFLDFQENVFGFHEFFFSTMYFRKKALHSNVVLRIVLILEKDTTAKEKEKNTGKIIWTVPCFNFHKKKLYRNVLFTF